MKSSIKENENVILSLLGTGFLVTLAFLILKKHNKNKNGKRTWSPTNSFYDNESPVSLRSQAYSETGILL